MRFKEGRQRQTFAELRGVLVGGKAGAIGGDLEEDTTRFPEVERPEVVAVDHRGRRDTELGQTALSWLWLAVLGVVQIALAYLLYAAGVRRLRAVESLMLASLEPILNPLWVALGTGERPSRAALCGGLLILLSVIGHGLHTTLRPKPPR